MTSDKPTVSIFWFRRDLRLHDNKGLYYALRSSENVLPLFILDTEILDKLPAGDHRVDFIHHVLGELDQALRETGSGLLIKQGKPLAVFQELLDHYNIESVFCNSDHEPYGLERDQQVRLFLDAHHIPLLSSVDHLIMEKNDVLKSSGFPYKVFTPYSRQWKHVLSKEHLQCFSSRELSSHFYRGKISRFPFISSTDRPSTAIPFPKADLHEDTIRSYDQRRDFPAMDGTTHVGTYLRFGTISIRELVKKAMEWNETFLNELIWREFYAMVLWHFPKVVNHAFKPEYDLIQWRNDEEEFDRWKRGMTGYAMVDAGMRQLSATGFMHNRLRMVTASFLSKHLLIDWRWGEAWFARKLFDYELSSNNGGWQWCAGSGTDASPYFRIFNPMQQQKKFDHDLEYIKRWIPEHGTSEYPQPIVDHKMARERCLMVYKKALAQK